MICSLFDRSGYMVNPWAQKKISRVTVDMESYLPSSNANVHFNADLSDPTVEAYITEYLEENRCRFISGFPPCTDLAVSGALRWKGKAEKDPLFQEKAFNLVKVVVRIADCLNVPYCIENPVSRLSTMWRKPDYIFHPCDFGGYLSEDDVHPDYPDYIPPRDAYTKKTCLWVGNGFIFPEKKPIEPITVKSGSSYSSPQYAKLGGKSEKTKRIRNATPRGFAQAVFEANS
jgi:hypothetical protein